MPGPKPFTDEQVAAVIRTRLTIDENGCHIWTGPRDPQGYGRGGWSGRSKLIHRALWEAVRGPLDPVQQLDHLCRVRACANLDHLEPVTARVNTLRSTAAAAATRRAAERTACPHGHPFTQENTRLDPQGSRHCRTCDGAARLRRAEARAAQRVAKYGYDPGPHARFRPFTIERRG